MIRIKYLIFCLFLIEICPVEAQSAYEIEVTVKDYPGEEALLAVRRGDKTYASDTAKVENGRMVFEGEKALPTGIYLVLLPPKNKYFEFIVTPEEQHISMQTDTSDLFGNLNIKKGRDNQLFLDYRVNMNSEIEKANTIQKQVDIEENEKKKKKLEAKYEEITDRILKFQDDLVNDNKGTFTSKIVNALRDVQEPVVPEGVEDENKFRYLYYREHFWDGFDFTERGFIRTPYIGPKIDEYLDKYFTQTPDSLKIAVDDLIERSRVDEMMFRVTLGHILNKYYRPKLVGLDEIFVHLAYKYYCGKDPIADWMSEDGKKNICDDAYMIKGVLIGNQAPNVTTQLYDNEKEEWTENMVSLYDIKADYTVVFLWKPGCGHCKKATDELKEFYEEYKDKGVEIFGITSAIQKDLEKAKKDLVDKKTKWITTADPHLKARALVKFYGRSLPKMYLLDKNKKIIASRLAGSQLADFIERDRKKQEEDLND